MEIFRVFPLYNQPAGIVVYIADHPLQLTLIPQDAVVIAGFEYGLTLEASCAIPRETAYHFPDVEACILLIFQYKVDMIRHYDIMQQSRLGIIGTDLFQTIPYHPPVGTVAHMGSPSALPHISLKVIREILDSGRLIDSDKIDTAGAVVVKGIARFGIVHICPDFGV